MTRDWTPAEDATLTLRWHERCTTKRSLERLLKRDFEDIYARVKAIGLPTGKPGDTEWLTEAAKRTGYATTGTSEGGPSTLVNILRWAKVRIYRPLRPASMPPDRRQYVYPDDADRAVAEWLLTEPLSVAAERVGYSVDGLVTLLRHHGYQLPREQGEKYRGKAMRLPIAVVDAATASRLLCEPLYAAARRHRMYPRTLELALIRDGRCKRPPQPVKRRAGERIRRETWYVPIALVDELVADLARLTPRSRERRALNLAAKAIEASYTLTSPNHAP